MAGPLILIVTVVTNAFLAGMLFALLPAPKSALAAHVQASERRLRLLHALEAILLVPLMVVAGLLIDKWGWQAELLAGGGLAALAFVALDRGSNVAAAALLAGAVAALTTASIAAMPYAFFPTHAARSVNLGSVVVLLGALVAAPLARLLYAQLGPRRAHLVLALACLAPAACAACAPDLEFAAAGVGSGWARAIANPRLAMLLLMAALCWPLEASLAPWVRRYVIELGYLPGSITLLWAGFWLAFVATRLVAAFFLPAGKEAVLVLVLAMVAAVTLGNLLGAYAPGSGGCGVWLTGACCGPLVPTVLGLVLQSHPAHMGLALGLANAAALLGGLMLLPWIDASRPGKSTRAVMRGATLLAVVLMAPALVLALLGDQ
jgi:hypothetical protein